MPPEPAPGSTQNSPTLTGSRSNQIQEVYNYIVDRITPGYGSQVANEYGNEWLDYAKKHPNVPVKQLFLAWFLNSSNLTAKLGQDIATGVTGAGAGANALTNALPGLSPIQWLSQPDLWVRVGEVIVGTGLVLIGVLALTKNTSAGKAVQKAGKAAIFK